MDNGNHNTGKQDGENGYKEQVHNGSMLDLYSFEPKRASGPTTS